jgi:hypothetical protein
VFDNKFWTMDTPLFSGHLGAFLFNSTCIHFDGNNNIWLLTTYPERSKMMKYIFCLAFWVYITVHLNLIVCRHMLWKTITRLYFYCKKRGGMVFNATFNNISVI